MPTITKKRDDNGWRVCVDGRPTSLLIVKGDPPRYRETQMYDVVSDADDSYVFEAKGVSIAMGILERLAEELRPA